jgi:hypothetical protein
MADEVTILTADEIIAALEQLTNNEDFVKVNNALDDLMTEQEIATQKALLWTELRNAVLTHLEEYNIEVIASVEGDMQTVFTITKDNLDEVFVPDAYNQINISGSEALVIDTIEQEVVEEEEIANLPTDDEEDWYEAEDDWENEEDADEDEGVQDDIDPGDSDAFIEEEDHYNEE